MGETRRLFLRQPKRVAGGFSVLFFSGAVVFSAVAQESAPADTQASGETYEEIQRMIENLENRVGKVGEAVPAETLDSLEKQVEEAVRLLTSRSEENLLLRGKASGLSDEIETMAAAREELSKRAEDAEKDRDQQVAALEQRLEKAEKERDERIANLEQLLAAAKKGRDEQVAELTEIRRSNAAKDQELKRLEKQLEAVVAELAALNDALEKSETRNRTQKKKITELDGKLARALATKVEEMARYRSEFFGKLREVLGERQDIRIVGDRFVFQSELLFASGEATLGEDGMEQLKQFATSLAKVAETIPKDIDWVLRVDGHTDRVPVYNNDFKSNWELSTARAVSVVKFLIEQGIPPSRLVAAGFGEFQPLDARDDEIAFRRNRRIEFKLTQK